MKITIQKSAILEFDTTIERKRINQAFTGEKSKETKEHLLTIVDLVEQGKWIEAYKELECKWWNEKDEELECSRLEFLGMLESKSIYFDPWMDYGDLIWKMANNKDNVYTDLTSREECGESND